MNLAVQEGARRQNHCLCAEAYAHLRYGSSDPITFQDQVVNGLLEQPQMGLVLQPLAHGRLVKHAVGLRACRTHGRPFARIQDAELDTCLVRRQCHGTAERVYLFDEMAFADAADRRVAAHLPERLDVVREQQGGAAHARSRQRGFGAGMAAADNNDIEHLRMDHGASGRSARGPGLTWVASILSGHLPGCRARRGLTQRKWRWVSSSLRRQPWHKLGRRRHVGALPDRGEPP